MNFPENVDYGTFYREATKKGIKVTSKYAGVNIASKISRDLTFSVYANVNGKRLMLGYFPFTKHGELMAHRRFVEHLANFPRKKSGKQKVYEEC